jgi:hypothetical protein
MSTAYLQHLLNALVMFLLREPGFSPWKPRRVVSRRHAIDDPAAFVVPVGHYASVPILPVFRNHQVGEIVAAINPAPILEITVKVIRINNDARKIL